MQLGEWDCLRLGEQGVGTAGLDPRTLSRGDPVKFHSVFPTVGHSARWRKVRTVVQEYHQLLFEGNHKDIFLNSDSYYSLSREWSSTPSLVVCHIEDWAIKWALARLCLLFHEIFSCHKKGNNFLTTLDWSCFGKVISPWEWQMCAFNQKCQGIFCSHGINDTNGPAASSSS